jgi:hypothetical protein
MAMHRSAYRIALGLAGLAPLLSQAWPLLAVISLVAAAAIALYPVRRS